MTTSFI